MGKELSMDNEKMTNSNRPEGAWAVLTACHMAFEKDIEYYQTMTKAERYEPTEMINLLDDMIAIAEHLKMCYKRNERTGDLPF
jgi:hypothetical protein